MLSTLLLPALLLPRPAEAAIRRIALLAANNEGGTGTRPLYFAEDDVHKVEGVLADLGDFDDRDLVVLAPATRRELIDAFGDVRWNVKLAHQQGDEVVFLFYYSGHADGGELLLGGTRLGWDELDTMIEKTGAEVRIAFVDACHSGAMTRAKGGTMAPSFVFDVSEHLGTEGSVIVTSSTRDEASQESDEIGGSYFTYYLAGGLAGTADRDGDGKVTLAEAYEYVYHETVIRTASTRSGTQHPTFEWDLAGEGDLVLTELDPARATLEFPPGLAGTYAVFDVDRRLFVGEVEPGKRLVLRHGRFQVQRRLPTHLQVAELRVTDGEHVDASTLDFRPVEYEDDIAKGVIQRRIRRASLPHSSVRILTGGIAAGQAEVRDAYLPPVTAGGASWRLAWRDGRWIEADILAGGGSGQIVPVPGEFAVDTTVAATVVGASAGFATRPASFQAGGGLRLEGIYLSRSFDGEQQLAPQYAAYPAPGLVGWAGWHPWWGLELDLELRSVYVPFRMDDRDKGFTMNQVLLGLGYRF